MCNYIVLHKDNSGYVTQCNSCNKFELAFGNVAIPIKESDFVVLYSAVTAELKLRHTAEDIPVRKIYLAIPESKIRLVFTLEELKSFQNLIQESYLQYEINKLLMQ